MPHVREKGGHKYTNYGYDYADERLDDEDLYDNYVAERNGDEDDDMPDDENSYNI